MKILENEDNSIIVGKSADDYILKYQNDFYKMKKRILFRYVMKKN